MTTRTKIILIGLWILRIVLGIGVILMCLFGDKNGNGVYLFIAFLGSVFWIDDPKDVEKEEE